jgi:hypothetical protein
MNPLKGFDPQKLADFYGSLPLDELRLLASDMAWASRRGYDMDEYEKELGSRQRVLGSRSIRDASAPGLLRLCLELNDHYLDFLEEWGEQRRIERETRSIRARVIQACYL